MNSELTATSIIYSNLRSVITEFVITNNSRARKGDISHGPHFSPVITGLLICASSKSAVDIVLCALMMCT